MIPVSNAGETTWLKTTRRGFEFRRLRRLALSLSYGLALSLSNVPKLKVSAMFRQSLVGTGYKTGPI